MAKDLVRTRHYVKKFMLMKANIQAVSLKITTLKSNDAMASAMKGVTKAMATMNKRVSVYHILRIFVYSILQLFYSLSCLQLHNFGSCSIHSIEKG
jgi:division protein CdvB (Snf7/Vps24/ESCRT-III family)